MAASHATEHRDFVDYPASTGPANEHLLQPELVVLEQATKPNIIVFTWRRLYASTLKRLIDIVVASGALLILSLAMLMVAVAIRLDSPGPVLYRQHRVGKDGRIFTIYKFRTMTDQASSAIRYFVSPDGTVCHKVRNDPRTTRLGKHLRRMSIDELPQLLNILRGDMSLIGPRPELVEIVRTYQPWQHRRHDVRPGLTGWWQVSGRGDRPMHENTELDLYYVDHFSPGLDLKILIRTIVVVLKGRGAF